MQPLAALPANNGFLIRDAAENGNRIDQVFHSRERGSDNPPGW
jgi:large repetitive protein